MGYLKLKTWRLCAFFRLYEANFTYSEFVYVKHTELSIKWFIFWNVPRAPACFGKNSVHIDADECGSLVE